VDFDLAVIPLRPSIFNEAKSDLALVEMSALGVPAIVSDVPGSPYRVLSGYAHLTSKGSDWTEHLRYLVDDAEAREQLGKEARERAVGRTIEGNVWRWEGV
jgi:glycosyltransferase involved in cell wall biosynthesis